MSLLRGLIGGIAKGGADLVDNQIKRESEQEAERLRNEAAMEREQSLLRLRNTLENENRAAAATRIDTATGKIADEAIAGKRALVGAGITDKSSWTPDQQAAVDQSLEIDRQAIVGDPMTRVRAAGMTGDLRADQVATVELNEQRAAREEKKGDQRYEIDKSRLDQQIKHQEATLKETIRHNKALEANAANRADKLSPAAKAQLEIASNGVNSAHKELSIAAKALDAAMKSGELDTEQKRATIAAAQAEFKAAKNAVDIANAHYNKVGQAHLGAEWKTIEEEKPQDKPKPTPTPAEIEGLKKRLNDPKAVAAFEARFGTEYTPKKEAPAKEPAKEPAKPEQTDPLQAQFDSETRQIETGKLRDYSAGVRKWLEENNARRDADWRSKNDKYLEEEQRRAKEQSRALIGR